MMRLKFFLYAALAGIALTGLASATRADFQLEYAINTGSGFGAFTEVITGGSGTVASPYYAMVFIGNLIIDATGGGTTTQPYSSLDLGVTGSEAAGTSIEILVSMNGVLTAPPPESLVSSMSNNVDTGSGNSSQPGATITMADYLAQSNTLFDTSTAVVGPQTIAPQTTLNNSLSVSLTPDYSWTLEVTLDNSANSTSTNNLSLGNNATLSTPAPAGLVLLASAGPVLLGGTWWRRRKTQQAR